MSRTRITLTLTTPAVNALQHVSNMSAYVSALVLENEAPRMAMVLTCPKCKHEEGYACAHSANRSFACCHCDECGHAWKVQVKK